MSKSITSDDGNTKGKPNCEARDKTLRPHYARAALAAVPRLLGAIDRNPYRSTYGCLDREFWHYRTASFPSQMYQEGALPLALVYSTTLPGNRWQGEPRVRELAAAAIRFAARSSHADGSCDDYYPFERALGAAVFSLQAAARAYQLLDLDDAELVAWLERRARWVAEHDESGRLTNHHALAALGLLRVAEITGNPTYRESARQRIAQVLAWQTDEGWFQEYDGADPGYQTVTIDCLAKIRRQTDDTALDEPLRQAVDFARLFLHPDDSYAGEYGSRGTYHFYPHGFELLACANATAADLADGFLRTLATGRQAAFDDDRMFIHRLGNLIEAYQDFSPERPLTPEIPASPSVCYLPKARLLVRRNDHTHTIISAARGGVFKHFDVGRPVMTDAGLIVETTDGQVAVSQMHEMDRLLELIANPVDPNVPRGVTVSGTLHWARFETVTPIKQAVFHLGMAVVGRWCRNLVRRALQRRLITNRRACPIQLKRTVELMTKPDTITKGTTSEGVKSPTLQVTDTLRLTSPSVRIRRMSYGTDHQAAYVAAANVYQDAVLKPWDDLAAHVDELNRQREVTIVRQF